MIEREAGAKPHDGDLDRPAIGETQRLAPDHLTAREVRRLRSGHLAGKSLPAAGVVLGPQEELLALEVLGLALCEARRPAPGDGAVDAGAEAGRGSWNDHEPDQIASLDGEVGLEHVRRVVIEELVSRTRDLKRLPARPHHRQSELTGRRAHRPAANDPVLGHHQGARPAARPARSHSSKTPAAADARDNRAPPGVGKIAAERHRPRTRLGCSERRGAVALPEGGGDRPAAAAPSSAAPASQSAMRRPAGIRSAGGARTGIGSAVVPSMAAVPGAGGGPSSRAPAVIERLADRVDECGGGAGTLAGSLGQPVREDLVEGFGKLALAAG